MANDTTKLLLGIADPYIKIKTGTRQIDGVIRFEGILDYQPLACPKCGIINATQIIKYGWRMTTVRFAKILDNAVILKLKRRYFHCKACQAHFLAQTELVPKHCTISNPTRQACLEKLAEPVALTHIAHEIATSDTFVGRQLLRAERNFHLTNALNWTFNQTRVRIMKKFAPSSREFKAFKHY